jgi:hypothetical protein
MRTRKNDTKPNCSESSISPLSPSRNDSAPCWLMWKTVSASRSRKPDSANGRSYLDDHPNLPSLMSDAATVSL